MSVGNRKETFFIFFCTSSMNDNFQVLFISLDLYPLTGKINSPFYVFY